MTSLAGTRPTGSSITYAMTKAALNHMTLLPARSCSPVRVNAVTPAHRSAMPDDCAGAVLALVRTTYVTGHVFVVGSSLVL